MNLPNTPFDNLYKFLAIFGLVIIGYSAFFISSSTDKLYKEAFDFDKRREVYNREVINITEKPKTMEQLKDSVSIAVDMKYFEHKFDKYNKRNLSSFIIFQELQSAYLDLFFGISRCKYMRIR